MTVPMPAFQVYSVVCTNKMWQKHKTFKDKTKSSTKTGLGPVLKAAEAAWAKIKWAELDAKKLKATTVNQANTNKQKATAMLAIVQQAIVAVEAARVKAEATRTNQSLSDSAKRQAEVIRNGMAGMKSRLETVSLNDFDAEIQRLQNAQ
jgi:hypothetical protein